MSNVIPFPATNQTTSTEDIWFWFIRAQQSRGDAEPGPCEPIAVLKALDGLYRARRVQMDHLLVLRHYGRRQQRPDGSSVRTLRLWEEAIEKLAAVLPAKARS